MVNVRVGLLHATSIKLIAANYLDNAINLNCEAQLACDYYNSIRMLNYRLQNKSLLYDVQILSIAHIIQSDNSYVYKKGV